jgi:hypothetical protein
VKAEHCRSIDALRWQREGILEAGRAGGWGWTDADTGERLTSIGHHIEPGTVVLSYTMNGVPKHQRLPILGTPCHFGGLRRWFGGPRPAVRAARSGAILARERVLLPALQPGGLCQPKRRWIGPHVAQASQDRAPPG